MQRMDAEKFLAAPVGGYVAGSTFVVWCHSPTLSGTVLWGAPSADDAREIARLWQYDRELSGYDFVVDASGLRAVDPEGLALLCQAISADLEHNTASIRRQMILLPRDPLVGAVVAGVPVFLESGHPWRAFTDEAEGLAWLSRADLPRAEISRMVTAARSEPATLASLRAHLEQHLDSASLTEVSHALGCSTRTLQRELARQGSTFRDELRRARVAAAAQLLALGDLKVEAVAWQVGYASTSHFVSAFLRETGEEPSAYRRSRRVPAQSSAI